jgi:hypothetical protein
MQSKSSTSSRFLWIVFLAAVLSACQSDATYYASPEDNPAYLPATGTKLALHQPLTIAPDKAGVYLQYGKTTEFNQIQRYSAHCRFEVYKLSTEHQLIQPDTFIIHKISQQQSAADFSPYRKIGRYDGGVAYLYYATEFYLTSTTQPNVFRLTCGHWLLANEGRYLSLMEIRSTLGDVITLQ